MEPRRNADRVPLSAAEPGKRWQACLADLWYRSSFGYALLGSLLLWAALPPLGLGPLAWIAPVPWLLLVRTKELPGKRPYRALWLAGFAFWLAAIYWLCLPHWATSFGWLALSFYLAFYLPVFVGLSRVAVHRLRVPVILAAPVVWAGLELARAHVITGFTMGALGHTQYRWITLIQVSDLTGGYGVDFLVMFGAACLARMVPLEGRRWAFWPVLPLGAVLGAVLVYGHFRMAIPPIEPQANIALIQGSIDIELKYKPEKRQTIYEHYVDLSREAVREAAEKGQKLDLIVWPETMFPSGLYAYDPNAQVPSDWEKKPSREEFLRQLDETAAKSRQPMADLARYFKTALLLGVDTLFVGPEAERIFFNSAAFVSPSGEVLGRYDKMHLVMFGEYVPFANRFPWLQDLTPLPGSLEAGERPAAFQVGGVRVAPNICYETVIPHVIRRQVNELTAQGQEPQVLVNLTNDGWFWGSTELDMHLVCGVFRAIECRKPLVIAANTGLSAWIDGDGRILEQGLHRQPRTILASVGPDPRHSWYLKHGDWFAGTCLAACLLLALVGAFSARIRKVPVA